MNVALTTHNVCRLGAAVVVNNLYIPSMFSRLIHNPLCVFLVENRDDNKERSVSVLLIFLYLS